ncbi:MAG: hypothetical protein EOO38_23100, partial [Cytophagaceae bacterium]
MFLLPSVHRAAVAGALLLGLYALPSRAATFTVSNLNDNGAGSLRQAITDANSASGSDVVTFAPNLAGTIPLALVLGISDSVRIEGPGADKLILKGNSQYQSLSFSSGTSFLSGVTVADASPYAYSSGAGISNAAGSDLTLSNCQFRNNTSRNGRYGIAGVGGAVSNNGTMTIDGCTFENNTASSGRGGAVNNIGTLSVSNSAFDANSACRGGAIYNSAILSVSNSTFNANTVSPLITGSDPLSFPQYTSVNHGLGSVLYNEAETKSVALTNCTLSGNTVMGTQWDYNIDAGEKRTGAIHNASGALSLINCTLSGNIDARTRIEEEDRIGTLVNKGTLSCLNTVFVDSGATPVFGLTVPLV